MTWLLVLLCLGVLVIAQRPAYKKLVQGCTPKVAKAGFVYRGDFANFMDRSGVLNQIAVLNPSPIEQPFPAASYVLLLLRNKEAAWDKTRLSWRFEFLAGCNHSSVGQNVSFKRIFW